jgi:hypothetical protein
MTLIALPESHDAGRTIDTQAAERAAAELLTAALHGVVRDDPWTRQEFLALTCS